MPLTDPSLRLGPPLLPAQGEGMRASGKIVPRGKRRKAVYLEREGRAMKVGGKHLRTIWLEADGASVGIIDQTRLPHEFVTARLDALEHAVTAIRTMQVRGAPLIGATAAYGLCLALRADSSDAALERAYAALFAARPTAINLKWGLEEIRAAVGGLGGAARVAAAYARAAAICEEDIAINRAIGRHGVKLIEAIGARKQEGEPVQIL